MGQMILKAGALSTSSLGIRDVTAFSSSSSNSSSVGVGLSTGLTPLGAGLTSVSAGLAPASGLTPQLFQFSNPFTDMLQHHGNQQGTSTATTPSATGSRMSTSASPAVGGHRTSSQPSAAHSAARSSSPLPSASREVKTTSSPKADATVMLQTYRKVAEGRNPFPLATRSEDRKSAAAASGTSSHLLRGSSAQTGPASSTAHLVSLSSLSSSDKTSGAGLNNACDVCDAAFPSHHQLVRHRSIHFHGQQKQNLKCSMCDKIFLSEGLLKRHQMADGHLPSAVIKAPSMPTQRSDEDGEGAEGGERVRGESALPLSCSFCSMAFESQGEMSNHLRSRKHVNTLERLGMLPMGTYERLSEDQAAVDSPKKAPPKSGPPLQSLSVSQDAAYLLEKHFSKAREALKASGNTDALSKISSSFVPKTGTPVREILSTLRRKEGFLEASRLSSAAYVPTGPHPGGGRGGTSAVQHEGKLGVDVPRTTGERTASSTEEAGGPRVVVVETSPREMMAARGEERAKFASSKKQKLQNSVHLSIDSDPDGDSHLVIDEGQGDVVGASVLGASASAATASSLSSPSLSLTAAGGGGGTDEKEVEAVEAAKEEEASGGSTGECQQRPWSTFEHSHVNINMM